MTIDSRVYRAKIIAALDAKAARIQQAKVYAMVGSFIRNLALTRMAWQQRRGQQVDNYTEITADIRQDDICVNL